MGLFRRLMLVLRRLRDPHAKPGYVAELERRQDDAERRINAARARLDAHANLPRHTR